MKRAGFLSGACLAAAFVVTVPAAGADGPAASAGEPKSDAKKTKKGAKPARPAPGKVYTEDDLKRYSEDPEGKASSESAPSPAAAPEPDSPSEASQAHGGRQHWASRAEGARAAIAEAQGQIAAIEARITGLRNDMAPGRETQAFREQGIQADIAKAMEELEAARKDLATVTKAHEDLLEEARRTGVPPGWVREP